MEETHLTCTPGMRLLRRLMSRQDTTLGPSVCPCLYLQDLTSTTRWTVTLRLKEARCTPVQLTSLKRLLFALSHRSGRRCAAKQGAQFHLTNTYFLGADAHHSRGVREWKWSRRRNLGVGEWRRCSHRIFHSDGTFWVEATGDSNEHGNDNNAYDQRGFDYITRDQMGYNYALGLSCFVKDRDQYQRLIFKAAANDNYPFEPVPIRDAYVLL